MNVENLFSRAKVVNLEAKKEMAKRWSSFKHSFKKKSKLCEYGKDFKKMRLKFLGPLKTPGYTLLI